ncbi:BPSL0067 family protein [Muricoccus radiodurans]|uniref:BPSL0067 family protein n=1 Tax=Muricoccus radiodurans TaxID=2231721 RepID=UPI003CEBF4DB
MTSISSSTGSPVPTLNGPPVRRPGMAFTLPDLPSRMGTGSLPVDLASMRSLLRLQEGFSSRPVRPSPVGSPGSAAAAQSAPVPVGPARRAAVNGLSGLFGRSVGSGQCVALVQAANPAIGPTRGWSRGAAVRGNVALQPGTAIATFDASGRYANARNGSSHAAIYLGQDATGIQVLDQWAGRAAAVRTIPWSARGATAANTGERFHVVVSATAGSPGQARAFQTAQLSPAR